MNNWATGGLLDMWEEMKSKLDYKVYKENNLVLVSRSDNENTDDNMSVDNLYKYDNDIKN